MEIISGYLELLPKGFGFLRQAASNLKPQNTDPFISPQLIKKYALKEGHLIAGPVKMDERGRAQLTEIELVNGSKPGSNLPGNGPQVSINPNEQINMCLGEKDITGKLLNYFVPVGKGQRGLILSPPKAGKTTLLHHFAQATLQNNPEIQVFVLLVDERPEEVTTFRRSLPGAVVFSSSSDEERNNHLRLTRLAMNIAMRAMESGQDVMVLIDSLTRMSRAYNLEAPNNSKIMSGGVSAGALDLPRRLFGSARNIENGGSLTILASILVDTGSRMDEVIFQEFKGTGNLDLVLSREAAESRLFPAIDLKKSGTRRDDLLLSHETLKIIAKHRILLAERTATEAVRFTLNWLRDSKELP